MKQMRDKGIEVQIGTYALHLHSAFSPSDFCRIEGDLAGSKYAFAHCLSLPLYHELTKSDQEVIVDSLKKIV